MEARENPAVVSFNGSRIPNYSLFRSRCGDSYFNGFVGEQYVGKKRDKFASRTAIDTSIPLNARKS